MKMWMKTDATTNEGNNRDESAQEKKKGKKWKMAMTIEMKLREPLRSWAPMCTAVARETKWMNFNETAESIVDC